MNRAGHVLVNSGRLFEAVARFEIGNERRLRRTRLQHAVALRGDLTRADVNKGGAGVVDRRRLQLVELCRHELRGATLARTEDERDGIFIKDAVAGEPAEHLPALNVGRIGSKRYGIAGLANRNAIQTQFKFVEPLPAVVGGQKLVVAGGPNLATIGQLQAEDLSLTDLRYVGGAMGAEPAMIDFANECRS